MNRLLSVVFLLSIALSVRAAGPEDQYIAIYYLIQQGDAASDAGRNKEALDRYTDAQASLQKLHRANPLWQSNVVSFRLSYLATRIISQGALAKSTAGPEKPAPAVPSVAAANPEMQKQVTAMQSQMRELQENNSSLQAKLREALSAQPAAVDPANLARAESRIKELARENELLKAGMNDGQTKPTSAAAARQLDQLRKDLEEAKKKMAAESARTEVLARQNSDLQDQLAKTITSPKDNGSRRSLQKQLDEATLKLAGQKEVADQLAREKAALAARLSSLEADTANTTALRAENDMLRNQIANLNNTLQQANNTNEMGRRLVAAEAQIAALQSERSLLHLERGALENRVNKLLAAATLAPTRAEDARRIKALEQDRDALQRQLAAANKQPATNKDKPAGGLKADELAAQLAAVRAKLDVYETKLVPYSPEELALFRQPVKLASTDQPARKSNTIPKPPAGARDLVIEAQRLFARGDFAEAELKYLELLKKDEKNLYTLANLAAIQIEQGKLDEAEKNLKQAIAVAPEDAYSMQMLGYLKFRQQKYSDALTALSQAAKLNPESAEVQNYLGVTLSNIGQRDAAERALRNALRLEPNYGSAHNNLAVIYATQEPPSVELARWHYQRALDAGNPKHPELEKLFEKKAAIAQ